MSRMSQGLKNAKIFDDDMWDENDKPKTPEIKPDPSHQEPKFPINPKIKVEPKEVTPPHSTSSSPSHYEHPHVKKEPLLDNIKEEEMDDTFEEELKPIDPLKKFKIKQELNFSKEEGELEDSMINVKTKTPPSPSSKLKFEGAVDKMFDESPYNKGVFNSLRLDEKTPVKNEGSSGGDLRNSLKSAKRSVFNRLSPYKMQTDTITEKIGVKTRLGSKLGSVQEEKEKGVERRKKYPAKGERDPEVIARREKQIEYGKNTIGYENYIKMLPRDERVAGDPKTPPLYNKYSRRGWEGLIKQWRIQLHQFDPPGESSNEAVEEEN